MQDGLNSLFLHGTLEDELRFNLRDLFQENCGLVGAVNTPDASTLATHGLIYLQHRGEKSCGVISTDGNSFFTRKRMGEVNRQFHGIDVKRDLAGTMATGHTRYATSGEANRLANIQPFEVATKYGEMCIAHNGTIAASERWKERLLSQGAVFQSTSDSEIIAHLIASSKAKRLEDAVVEAFNHVKAAFSVVMMTKDLMIAARDWKGIRPLSYASYKDPGSYMVASENYLFDQILGCTDLGEIKPGQLAIFRTGSNQPQFIQYADKGSAFCIFEAIYFSYHESEINGVSHNDFRQACGQRLFETSPQLQELPKDRTIVFPIPDSGIDAAIGFSKASGYELCFPFSRLRHYPNAPGRSFTASDQGLREAAARAKLFLKTKEVKGMNVIVIEDSIVRGTTAGVDVQRLRSAGANEVHFAVASAPIQDICPYGIDIQRRTELAYVKCGSVVAVKSLIGADTLSYLSLNAMRNVASQMYKIPMCDGCFSGKYPIPYKTIRKI